MRHKLTNQQQIDLCNLLPTIVRPLMLQAFTLNSCIGGTRIVIEVLRKFRIPAVPVACRTFVYNDIFLKWMHESEFRFPDADEKLHLAKIGAFAAEIGKAGQLTHAGWDGHLIAVIPNLDHAIDISIDAVNVLNPLFNMKPFCFKVPKGFVEGESVVNAEMGKVWYQMIPSLTYKLSNDWLEPSRTRRIIEIAVKKIRSEFRRKGIAI